MSAGPFLLMANPLAGRGRAAVILDRAVTALQAAGAQAYGELTRSTDHASELAAAAARDGMVSVAVGGDGLVRAVAAGACRHSGVIGIVPAGRGNDYARAVGLTSIDISVRVLLTAVPRPADLIAVTGDRQPAQVAIGNVYLGFDSLSNALANRFRLGLGGFGYKYAALQVAVTMRPMTFRLTLDGVEQEVSGSGVAITNSGFYGAGIPIAPMADVHDGLLDVVIFESTNRLHRIPAMISLTRGRHLDRSDVRHQQVRQVQVSAEPGIEAYSDGDPICRPPFTATVRPGAIRLLRP